jgi:response regulator NasT
VERRSLAMKEKKDSRYSVLIVSSSEQFNTLTKKVLPDRRFDVIEVRKSASSARRELLVREYDLIIINAPLQEGLGTDFVLDIVEKHSSGIIFAVPNELFINANDHLIEYGVLTIAKPLELSEMERMIKLVIAMNDRLRQAQKKLRTLTEKLDELKERMLSDEIYLTEGREPTFEELAKAHDQIKDEAVFKVFAKDDL